MVAPEGTENESSGYKWEQFTRTWDELLEDPTSGAFLIQQSSSYYAGMERLKATHQEMQIVRGLLRQVVLILDLSTIMLQRDSATTTMKPNYIEYLMATLSSYWISEFFEQNPLARIALVGMRDGVAIKLLNLSGNAADHRKVFEDLKDSDQCKGDISLQNALQIGHSILKSCHDSGITGKTDDSLNTSHEILILQASLTTRDPSDIILDTLPALIRDNIRVSFISLTAEMKISKKITKMTQGSYKVALDDKHLRDLLYEWIVPPPSSDASGIKAALVRMGFPKTGDELHNFSGNRKNVAPLCACHHAPILPPALTVRKDREIHRGGLNVQQFMANSHTCPQCSATHCYSNGSQLPHDCTICGLKLVSSPHLARSFHYLFPIPSFKEIHFEDENSETTGSSERFVKCEGCQLLMRVIRRPEPGQKPSASRQAENRQHYNLPKDFRIHETLLMYYSCPACKNNFCPNCNLFIHENLHTCPGCG